VEGPRLTGDGQGVWRLALTATHFAGTRLSRARERVCGRRDEGWTGTGPARNMYRSGRVASCLVVWCRVVWCMTGARVPAPGERWVLLGEQRLMGRGRGRCHATAAASGWGSVGTVAHGQCTAVRGPMLCPST
jgi:hypothetical protein